MLKKHAFAAFPFVVVSAALPMTQAKQDPRDPSGRIKAQQAAMNRLSFMDGIWKGTAWILSPSGEKKSFQQTERIGPFLDGTLKVIEGRGYESDGTVNFNAFAVLSYNPDDDAYTMRSYTMGRSGDYALTPKSDGFVWEIPAGPTTIRYTATFKDETWHQIGERMMPDDTSIQFFEMTLERKGDTDWPAGGAVSPESNR